MYLHQSKRMAVLLLFAHRHSELQMFLDKTMVAYIWIMASGIVSQHQIFIGKRLMSGNFQLFMPYAFGFQD